MSYNRIGRLVEGGPEDDYLSGTRWRDTIYGYDGDDVINGGRGKDFLFGGSGFDVFVFNDQHAGDASFGRADTIGDFSSEDLLDLRHTEILYFAGFGVVEPERGGFSIWEARGDVYVSWNTFGKYHDVKLTGFDGDLFNILGQIRWYEDDYLGSVATSASIAPGQTVTGTIEVDVDQDWFGIELEEGLLYTFDLQGEAQGGGTLPEPNLTLYDASGNYVTDAFEELLYVADTPGSYFISAESFGSTGSYTLEVTAEPYVDDFGDDLGSAGEIAPGDTVSGTIGAPFDEDLFRIEFDAGETYTIDLRGASSESGSLPDPFLRLLNDEGEELASNDDFDGFDSQIVYDVTSTGTYFIAARELGAGTGTYELSVSDANHELLLA